MIDNELAAKATATNNSFLRRLTVLALSSALTVGSFASTVATAQNADENQTYSKPIVIRPGDTLSHIALREMGDENLAQELADANGLALEQILKPGDTINIPVTLPVRDEFASIIFHKGQVTKNGENVQTDDKVRRNDNMETGHTGYASLEFLIGTLINIQPNTKARILTLFCQPDDDICVIEMAADRGALSTDVQSEDNQPVDFRVQTPYASAAVRGTVFDISADSNTGIRIGVTEGAVSLGSSTSDQVVDLESGFGSVAAPGRPLSPPIALLPAPVFRFVPPRITPSDVVRWFGLTDVNRYIVQIAAAPSGAGVIHEAAVTNDRFGLSNTLTPGDYHILLRPVDDNGLLGYTATSPITIAEIDTAIAPVSVSVNRVDGNYTIEIVQKAAEASGYEVQIASEIEFNDPISVDVNETGNAVVRISGDKIYARARALVDRTTVGPYGEPTTVNE